MMNPNPATGLYRALTRTATMAVCTAMTLGAQARSFSHGPHAQAEESVEILIETFAKKSTSAQKKILDAVRDAARQDNAWGRAVRDWAAAAETKSKSRVPSIRIPREGRAGKKQTARMTDQLPFPVFDAYRFGFGTIEDVDGKTARGRQAEAERIAELRALCAGHAPQLDRALAEVLRTMDTERSIDRHAAFLETWYVDGRPMYDAMQSAAGAHGVFFYDSMLELWVRTCVPKDHPDRKSMIRGPKQAAAPFQAATKNYRAYRSLREAFALAILLPPDERFPGALQSFEDDGGHMHSAREVFEILVAANGFDPSRAIDLFVQSASAMPTPAWSGSFEPWEPIYTAFDAVVKDLDVSSEQLLADYRKWRVEQQQDAADRAAEVLREALGRR